jgi:hypothetical protein
MLEYLLIFSSQVIYNILKVLEIKFIYLGRIGSTLLNSVLINLTSLASVFLSLEGLFSGDWYIVPTYVVGAVCGKYIAMRLWKKP